MANDIVKCINLNSIKNGSVVVSCLPTGFPNSPSTIVNHDRALDYPIITDIQNRYEDRFDNVGYDCIGNATIVGG